MAHASHAAGKDGGIVGLLDVGTFKIVCLIAALPAAGTPGAGLRLLGIGHRKARGIKASVIADPDLAEAAVRAAISQAERMAGAALDTVYLSVASGRLKSLNFDAATDIAERVVGDGDIARVLAAGRAYGERDGRAVLHLQALGYRVDGGLDTEVPNGLVGRRLTAGLHAVVADDAPLRSLLDLAGRCKLRVAGLAAAPYASAIAVTSENERRHGVVTIDMGGGSTTLAIFVAGRFVYATALPVGSHHATYDLARRLSTSLAEAERIKTLHGTIVRAPSDATERIAYQYTGGGEPAPAEIGKAEVAGIIAPRVASLFAMLAERIDHSGIPAERIGSVVLTGGASQLVGVADFASSVLGRPVRIGRPVSIDGRSARVLGPAFATAAGLMATVLDPQAGVRCEELAELSGGGYLGRVGQWLRAGF